MPSSLGSGTTTTDETAESCESQRRENHDSVFWTCQDHRVHGPAQNQASQYSNMEGGRGSEALPLTEKLRRVSGFWGENVSFLGRSTTLQWMARYSGICMGNTN